MKNKKVCVGLMILAVVIIVRLFIGELAVVPSESMEPAILAGSRIWIQKMGYGARLPQRFADIPLLNVFTWIPLLREYDAGLDWGYHRTFPHALPHRGDLIVFSRTGHDGQLLVKRAVAFSGDTVLLRSGRLYVNGCEQVYPCLQEDSLSSKVACPPDKDWTTLDYGPICLPYKGEEVLYFVLGDNRAHSIDSRYWGLVSESEIIGKAIVLSNKEKHGKEADKRK